LTPIDCIAAGSWHRVVESPRRRWSARLLCTAATSAPGMVVVRKRLEVGAADRDGSGGPGRKRFPGRETCPFNPAAHWLANKVRQVARTGALSRIAWC